MKKKDCEDTNDCIYSDYGYIMFLLNDCAELKINVIPKIPDNTTTNKS